ncbi:MAG TPA: DNA recombination protein RmuC [Patescibacteria group bacterium]|nr:DNA recombination protein RmuC [Patescibacteria group bacterium]
MPPATLSLGLALVLAVGLVIVLIVLLRPRTTVDPGLALLQQQVSELGRRLGEVGATIPREIQGAMTTLSGQVGARLAENAQVVQRAGSDTGRLVADVARQLGEIAQGSRQILELGKDLKALQQIFEAPTARGAFGEQSLALLLGQSFPREHVLLQHEFKDGERVDALLRLPGGGVAIDAKFPLAQFRAALQATGDEARVRALRSFGRDVRRHVDDIATKYIRPAEGTLDFALMYVPAESVFYEVIVRGEAVGDDDLNAYALGRHVVPVSPNSLYAYLQAIAYGLMGLKLEARARAVVQGLRQLQTEMETFRDSFDLAQKHLRNAATQLTEAAERYARIETRVGEFAGAVDRPADGGPAA